MPEVPGPRRRSHLGCRPAETEGSDDPRISDRNRGRIRAGFLEAGATGEDDRLGIHQGSGGSDQQPPEGRQPGHPAGWRLPKVGLLPAGDDDLPRGSPGRFIRLFGGQRRATGLPGGRWLEVDRDDQLRRLLLSRIHPLSRQPDGRRPGPQLGSKEGDRGVRCRPRVRGRAGRPDAAILQGAGPGRQDPQVCTYCTPKSRLSRT